ncbi:MAG: glycosyltransferase family 39 protein [Chloroflexota bacterium]
MLAIALATRLWGIDWQLPAALYFDEMKYVAWAGGAKDDAGTTVTDLRNPTLYHHLLQVEYAVAALVRPDVGAQQTAVFELHLARVTNAVLGALACLATAFAAASVVRAVGGLRRPPPTLDGPTAVPPAPIHPVSSDRDARLAGLAAGSIVAVALLPVHMAHYAVNDTAASLFLALTLLFGSRALGRPRRRDLALAGLAAGLAFSTKYSFGVGLMLPLAAAVLTRGLGAGLRERVIQVLLVTASFVVGAAVGAPEILLTPDAVMAGIVEQARLGSIRWNGQPDAPIWQLYGQALAHGLGWSALLAAGFGALALGRRCTLALFAQLTVPVVCLGVMLRQELFFARFALPLIPTLAILAGIGVTALARLGVRGSRERSVRVVVLAVVVLGLVLLPQIAMTVRHNQLATTTDTRVLARRWLQQRGDGARVASELYGQPIAWAGSVAPRGFRLQRVANFVEPGTVTRLACDGTRYFLVASITSDREIARHGPRPGGTGYDLLAREARVRETFDPYMPGATPPPMPDNTGIPFWYLEAYARPGPKITLYELPDGAIKCG